MSTGLIFALMLLIAVAGLLCNSGAWLWLAGKWMRIPGFTYLRALLAALLLNAVNLTLYAAVQAGRAATQGAEVFSALVFLAAAAIVGTIAIKVALGIAGCRAAGAWLFTMIMSSLAALPVLIPLRLFVLEAFVIPTGSMAPAIIGRHFDVRCPRCGFSFAVSATGEDQFRHAGPQVCTCPNCRAEQTLVRGLPADAGDRVVVDKLGQPVRWKPIVFRVPAQMNVNYLHRLVGLPNETVEIIGGDLFINGRRERKAYGIAPEMWQVVNDTRLRPSNLQPEDPQWMSSQQPSSNWQWDGNNGWRFAGLDSPWGLLAFSGPLTDESFYHDRWDNEPDLSPPSQPVGDLQVTCSLAHFSGAGGLEFRWAFQEDEVRARIAADGGVEIETAGAAKQARLPRSMAETSELVFAVRDGYALIGSGGKQIAEVAVGPQDADTCRDLARQMAEPCRLAIAAERCNLTLSRILIERDVYYHEFPESCTGCSGNPITLGPGEHFVLGDHSRFANDSRLWQELDPRFEGRAQVGAVPSKLIVGVVRSTYWPPRRWRDWR